MREDESTKKARKKLVTRALAAIGLRAFHVFDGERYHIRFGPAEEAEQEEEEGQLDTEKVVATEGSMELTYNQEILDDFVRNCCRSPSPNLGLEYVNLPKAVPRTVTNVDDPPKPCQPVALGRKPGPQPEIDVFGPQMPCLRAPLGKAVPVPNPKSPVVLPLEPAFVRPNDAPVAGKETNEAKTEFDGVGEIDVIGNCIMRVLPPSVGLCINEFLHSSVAEPEPTEDENLQFLAEFEAKRAAVPDPEPTEDENLQFLREFEETARALATQGCCKKNDDTIEAGEDSGKNFYCPVNSPVYSPVYSPPSKEESSATAYSPINYSPVYTPLYSPILKPKGEEQIHKGKSLEKPLRAGSPCKEKRRKARRESKSRKTHPKIVGASGEDLTEPGLYSPPYSPTPKKKMQMAHYPFEPYDDSFESGLAQSEDHEPRSFANVQEGQSVDTACKFSRKRARGTDEKVRETTSKDRKTDASQSVRLGKDHVESSQKETPAGRCNRPQTANIGNGKEQTGDSWVEDRTLKEQAQESVGDVQAAGLPSMKSPWPKPLYGGGQLKQVKKMSIEISTDDSSVVGSEDETSEVEDFANLLEQRKKKEGVALAKYASIFKDDQSWRQKFLDGWKLTCDICFSKRRIKRFTDVMHLLAHARTAKKLRQPEHRGYAKAIINLLQLDQPGNVLTCHSAAGDAPDVEGVWPPVLVLENLLKTGGLEGQCMGIDDVEVIEMLKDQGGDRGFGKRRLHPVIGEKGLTGEVLVEFPKSHRGWIDAKLLHWQFVLKARSYEEWLKLKPKYKSLLCDTADEQERNGLVTVDDEGRVKRILYGYLATSQIMRHIDPSRKYLNWQVQKLRKHFDTSESGTDSDDESAAWPTTTTNI